MIFFTTYKEGKFKCWKRKNVTKDVRILFRLEKLKTETIYATIKNKRNLFRLEKEHKAIKGRIIRDIRTVCRLDKENKAITDRTIREHEDDSSKPVTVDYFQSIN